MNQQVRRIIIEIILGVALSALLCFILIFMGYGQINTGNASSYNVNLFGLKIYHITKEGSQTKGSAFNNNMMFIGVIISVLLVIISETFFSMKGKKK